MALSSLSFSLFPLNFKLPSHTSDALYVMESQFFIMILTHSPQALEVIGTLVKQGFVFTNHDLLLQHFQAVFNALEDPNLPIKVQAALVLNEFITHFESGMPDLCAKCMLLTWIHSSRGYGTPGRQIHPGSPQALR